MQQQKKGEQCLGDQYQDNSEVHTNLLCILKIQFIFYHKPPDKSTRIL